MINSTYNEALTYFTETEKNDFIFFSIFFTAFFIGPWMLIMKLWVSFMNLIEDLYIDYIGYKFFYEGIVLPDLGERKNWCKKTDWTVEWKSHKKFIKLWNCDGTFIYTNTKTNEEYKAGIDDGPPEDSF